MWPVLNEGQAPNTVFVDHGRVTSHDLKKLSLKHKVVITAVNDHLTKPLMSVIIYHHQASYIIKSLRFNCRKLGVKHSFDLSVVGGLFLIYR
jgi:hypothetical protein